MTTTPVYLPARKIAKHLHLNPNNINKIIKKWRTHPTNPTPRPDAYYETDTGIMPLWHSETLPTWQTWRDQRRAIIDATQAEERAATELRARQTATVNA